MKPRVITDEQLQDELAERKEAEALLNDQRRVLELVASSAPLSESLDMLVRLIEEHAPGMLGSILLLDEEGVHLHHGAAPSLPREYSAAIDGVCIGPVVGSCGTAAFFKEAVYVEDIATDPLWSEFKGVALPHGLRACWSTPVFDAQGRVLGTFAMYYRQPGLPQPYHRRLIEITTHITAIAIGRHRMENDLRRITLFQRTVLDSAAHGIISTTPDGVVTSFNPAAERLLHYTADEVVGRQTPQYWHDPEEIAQRALQLSEELGETILPGFDVFAARPRRNILDENEWTFIRKDGTRVPVLLSLTALRGENGDITGFVGMTYDLTERKRAEEEVRGLNTELRQKIAQLQEAQEELVRKEKLSILGQLSGSVGHELRTPLGVMSNAVYFLNMVLPEADQTVKEYLGIIEDEIKNSQRIITDLLDFARTRTPQRQSVTPGELVRQSLQRCNIPDDVTVTLDIPEDLPALHVDPQQMEQVLTNLINNGVQAMPGGGALRIAARLADGAVGSPGSPGDGSADFVAIGVEDTGAGIAPENTKKLFQPLFTTKAKGIGLGLVVCRNLVESNGGRIEVESAPGKGTTFTAMLPVERGRT